MPRIKLKPNSAEYEDDKPDRPQHRACDMPGCTDHGEYKAPRDRSLKHYYRFCLEHVQEYNKAWDFFSGMSQRDIEDHIVRSALGDRPTMRYDAFATLDEQLRRRAWQTYHFTDRDPPEEHKNTGKGWSSTDRATPEVEALAIMNLSPPLDLAVIKTRYKELVKKYHPDVNPGDPKAAEMIKSINMAYTILRLACKKYEDNYQESSKT